MKIKVHFFIYHKQTSDVRREKKSFLPNKKLVNNIQTLQNLKLYRAFEQLMNVMEKSREMVAWELADVSFSL
jgi:hypothetical protein